MIKTKDLIDQKWDAIDSASKTIGEVRSDLFDHVALALSRIEGKLNFLKSDNLDGESRFSDDFSRETAEEILENVNQTRKELDKIFVKLTEGRNNLFS